MLDVIIQQLAADCSDDDIMATRQCFKSKCFYYSREYKLCGGTILSTSEQLPSVGNA